MGKDVVTLKQVANLAGVSTATVSRVVSGKNVVAPNLRERVQKVIKETGYRPNANARALANKRSDTIGLVTPGISLSFFGTLATGVIDSANELGLRVHMSNSSGSAESDIESVMSFRRQGCENIILDSLHCDTATLTKLCNDISGLVLISRFIPNLAERCVCVDNVTGGIIAASHLIDNGHRDIAIFTSDSSIQDPLDRAYGAKQVLDERGAGSSDEMLIKRPPTLKGGKLAVDDLLKSGVKFTAILTYNDNMAVGAMNELLDRGIRVPEDVSIVGFDNLFFSETCRPALTTLHYPIREMAAYAARLSIDLTRDENTTQSKTHRFIPNLVERQSVKNIG